MKFSKKAPYTLLRLVVGVGIIVYLFSRMDLHGLMTILRESLTRWP